MHLIGLVTSVMRLQSLYGCIIRIMFIAIVHAASTATERRCMASCIALPQMCLRNKTFQGDAFVMEFESKRIVSTAEHAVGRNTQVRHNYTTPHKTQMIDTTINLLVNQMECTNLSSTTLNVEVGCEE